VPIPALRQPVYQAVVSSDKPLLVLGVYIRARNAVPMIPEPVTSVPIERYWGLIDNYISYHEPEASVKLFFSSDDQGYMDTAMTRYADRAFQQPNVPRAPNGRIWTEGYQPDAHQKGVSTLVDSLMLSKCNFLLKAAGAIGEFAIYFNPSLMFSSYDLSIKDHPLPVWARSPTGSTPPVLNATTSYSQKQAVNAYYVPAPVVSNYVPAPVAAASMPMPLAAESMPAPAAAASMPAP
jgi:hypothetical protein